MEEPLFLPIRTACYTFLIYVLASYVLIIIILMSHFHSHQPMYHYPTPIVLRLSTNGVNGEHHWCGVINTLEYTTKIKPTYY